MLCCEIQNKYKWCGHNYRKWMKGKCLLWVIRNINAQLNYLYWCIKLLCVSGFFLLLQQLRCRMFFFKNSLEIKRSILVRVVSIQNMQQNTNSYLVQFIEMFVWLFVNIRFEMKRISFVPPPAPAMHLRHPYLLVIFGSYWFYLSSVK